MNVDIPAMIVTGFFFGVGFAVAQLLVNGVVRFLAGGR
jgi:hypothetical protein